MTIQLYNTLHRQLETFTAIQSGQATIYTCGPTVYDYAHIGNLRAYIFADTLRRVLAYSGLQVTQAMNITDVGHLVGDSDEGEDKMEVGARREGAHPLELARRYEEQFWADLKALGILVPDKVQRASETIEAQIELITQLQDKGFTYQTASGIYFDTSRLSDYGKLTGQALDEKRVGARDEVVVDSEKRHPQDFVVWFFLTGRYASHILHWSSPWGEGFPGWHLECSAISRLLLGQPFDIHTGGVDHIGTHHTNEIAQSEAAYDLPLAHYWLHNEFLLVDNHRMGKSEGNLITLAQLREKGFSPLDFRYWCLMGHYRSKMNFTWEALEGARRTRLSLQRQVAESGQPGVGESVQQAIAGALAADLDTPRALALLHDSHDPALWGHFDSVLNIFETEVTTPIPQLVLDLVAERNKARLQSDWQRADELRHQIEQHGWMVEDKADHSTVYPAP